MSTNPPGPYEAYPGNAPAYGAPEGPWPGQSPVGGHGASPHYSPAAHLGLPDGVFIASVGRRVGAFFLAIALCMATLVIGYFIWGLIAWSKGTSPALQVLGMKAWKPERRGVANWGDMALRNGVDWLISNATCGISSIVSFVMFLGDEPYHRTLADRIGGTVIVHDPYKRLR